MLVARTCMTVSVPAPIEIPVRALFAAKDCRRAYHSLRPLGVGEVPGSITLHEEIASILAESSETWMTTSEIAKRLNARGRYQKRDGSAVTAYQIHGRTNSHPTLLSATARACDSDPVAALPMPSLNLEPASSWSHQRQPA